MNIKILLLAGLVFAVTAPVNVAAADTIPSAPPAWRQASGKRVWNFPRDHGAHPDYRTEWWYFTGNLRTSQNHRYGYQLTFFRQGIQPSPRNRESAWTVRDVYPAHFAVTDIGQRQFRFAEQISRAGPGLAGSETGRMKVWCLQWSARMEQEKIFLQAGHEGMQLNLALTARKPLVLHGQHGLSSKGPLAGNATYYYSFTDLATQGTIATQQSAVKGSATTVPVTGTSWFDHEFGSNQLSRNHVGWDWFSIHLTDGRDLMLYLLRKRDGSIEGASSGTLVEKSGRSRHLELADIGVEILDRWQSLKSSDPYPARWRLTVPTAGIDLTMGTSIADQELKTSGSTGIIYYEGSIDGQGKSAGQPVSATGYVELTGYAGSLGGII